MDPVRFIKRNKRQTLSAKTHKHDIDCQPVQPGRKGRVATEGGNLAVQLKEGFLGQILSFRNIANHT
jgi:hypothetical protein